MPYFITGVAQRSLAQPDPILHLLVRCEGKRVSLRTWCGDGPAEAVNTVTQRRCRKCLALAKRDLTENDVADDEETDLDWYLQRHVPRKVCD